MLEVRETREFFRWLERLADGRARWRIVVRIRRLSLGNLGDVRAVGEGISEMRIAYGPGYRVYFTRTSHRIVMLLIGGDKSTQERDIKRAKRLARRV